MKHRILPSLIFSLLLPAIFSGCSRSGGSPADVSKADADFKAGKYDTAEIAYLNALKKDPKDNHALGQLAIIYFEEGRYARAGAFLLRTREKDPENLDARSRLAQAMVSTGQQADARKEAQFILGKKPGDERALFILADTSNTPGEIEEARKALESALQNGKPTAMLMVVKGTVEYKSKNMEAAEKAFNEALQMDPRLDEAHSAAAVFYIIKQDFERAATEMKLASENASPRSPKRIQYAQLLIRTGKNDEARAILEKMIEAARDYIPSYVALAEFEFNQKKFDKVHELLKTIVARDPGNEQALFLGGRLKLAEGNAAAAIEDLTRMKNQHPEYPPAHFHLAMAYLATHDTSQAIGELQTAVRLNPNYADAILALSELQIRNGEINPAMVALQSIIDKQPTLVQAYMLLASAHLRKKDLNEALKVYDTLEKRFPNNPQTPFLKALVHVQQKKFSVAREEFETVLKMAPTDIAVVEKLIDLDLLEGQFDSAKARAGKLDEGDIQRHILMSKICTVQKDFPGAEAALKRAMEIQPDSPTPCVLLARLYIQFKKGEEALKSLDAALTKNPKNIGALLLQGMVLENLEKFDAAAESYEKLLVLQPDFPVALNNLAVIYAQRLGKIDKGLEMARKVQAMAPKDPNLADTLGWILHLKGDDAQAVVLLQQSADLQDKNAEVWAHLGTVRYLLGDESGARKALERSLELADRFEGRDDVVQQLGILNMKGSESGTKAELEAWLKKHPGDPVVLMRLAREEEKNKSYDQALELYQQILRVNPKSAGALIAVARIQADAKHDLTQALETATRAYQIAPGNQDVTFITGRIAYAAGNHAWASSLLREAARQQPDSPEVLYHHGVAEYAVGNLMSTTEALRKVIKMQRENPWKSHANRFLGLLVQLEKPENFKVVRPVIEKTLGQYPDLLPARMMLGRLDEVEGKPDEARKIYEKVAVDFPAFAPAKARLAEVVVAQSGDLKMAEKLASEAHAALPEDYTVTRLLGIIAFKKGDYARSRTLLQECLSRGLKSAELLYYLGMAQHELKATAESRTTLKQAMELKLKPEWASAVEKILAEKVN